jgi:hypothetical protein
MKHHPLWSTGKSLEYFRSRRLLVCFKYFRKLLLEWWFIFPNNYALLEVFIQTIRALRVATNSSNIEVNYADWSTRSVI